LLSFRIIIYDSKHKLLKIPPWFKPFKLLKIKEDQADFSQALMHSYKMATSPSTLAASPKRALG